MNHAEAKNYDDASLPADFGRVAEQLRRSTVRVESGADGSGSGVIWRADGLVITNAHVAASDSPHVELWDGRALPARVLGRDHYRDLAALQVNARGLPAIASDRRDPPRPGELAIAVGNPLGFTGALTTGLIHAVGPFAGTGRKRWVQAAVRLAPGNSGGPLADAQGRILGVNTMLVAGGLALAVPASDIEKFIDRGAAPGPALGVTVRPIAAHSARFIALMILEIDAASPAATASLLPGDILIAANGRPFYVPGDLSAAIEECAPGVLDLRFLRGGRSNTREVHVHIDSRRAAA